MCRHPFPSNCGRIIITFEKNRKNVYVTITDFACKKFVQLVSDCLKSPFNTRALYIRVFTNLKLNALCFNNFWKVEPRNTLLLSVRTKMGRRFRGFIYLSSFKTVSNASLTALPVIDFNGKISKYFEKTITIRRYL